MAVVLIFVFTIVFIALSVPIGISIGLSTLLAMMMTGNVGTALIAQKAFTGVDSFTLLAIPLFILSGQLMTYGGISKRLVKVADDLIGFVTGGYAMVTTVACMFFSAISGSAPATASAIGSFMIPEMKKRNYSGGFACAITACAGSIGVIIPPSVAFVIYGNAVGVSITDLFVAGVIPGILVGVGLMVVSHFVCKKNGWMGNPERACLRQFLIDLKDAFWAILMPVIMLGGIYAGVFTPTEAAVISVVYAFFVSMFIYRELTWKQLIDSCISTALINGATSFMIALSASFANYLTMQQVAAKAVNFIGGLNVNKVFVFMLVLLLLLFVGCFIDSISSTVILAPILLPIMQSYGMGGVQFGIMMTIALCVGFVTPPYGCNLFVASGIGKTPLEETAKASIPMIASMLFITLCVMFIEPLSMMFLS